jgi:hypothetical protein
MSNENNYLLLYKLLSTEPYTSNGSWCLPNDFIVDELLIQKIVVDGQSVEVKEKPFILAGPEFNTFK